MVIWSIFHRGEHLEVGAEGQLDFWVGLEEVEDADSFRENLVGISGDEVVESSLGGAGGLQGGEQTEIASCRRLRELDVASEQGEDAYGLVDWEGRWS